MSLAIAPVTVSSPLVTVPRYRSLTGDASTPDATVSTALIDAQSIVEDFLRRPLELGTRTERLRLYRAEYIDGGYDGAFLCYPKATPVSAAPGFTVLASNSIAGAFPDGGPFLQGIVGGGVQPYATITYTGGWTETTLPVSIARAIARTAQNLTVLSLVPVGTTSVRVGDTAVTYGGGAGHVGASIDPSSVAALRQYVRRRGA